MRETFDHERGRWVAEEMGETVLPRIAKGARSSVEWRASHDAIRALDPGGFGGAWSLFPIFYLGLLIADRSPLTIFMFGGLGTLGVASIVQRQRRKGALLARFGEEEGAVLMRVIYDKYEPYGEDIGAMFVDDDGSLVFDGVASSWVIPAGVAVRADSPVNGFPALAVATPVGKRWLRCQPLYPRLGNTFGSGNDYLARPSKLAEIDVIPTTPQPGFLANRRNWD